VLFENNTILVDPGQSLLRIDKFLMDRLANVTRNKIQNAIKNNFVLVNQQSIKANYRVRPNDEIKVFFLNPSVQHELIPECIPLEIVYEDDDLLIVNKPPGMVVHPAHANWNGTLVNALLHHFKMLPVGKDMVLRPGLVHRIDKDTSGLLVIAKTEASMAVLAKQFYEHTIERTYIALVWGVPKSKSGTINVNIGRSPKDRRIMTTFADGCGRKAVTHYEVLKEFNYISLVKCNLETGRTHQIRIHMKHIGHTIFNDIVYGGDKILKGPNFAKYKTFVENCFKILPRQALHAKSLGFMHPTTKQKLNFECDLPVNFVEVLEKWEKLNNNLT